MNIFLKLMKRMLPVVLCMAVLVFSSCGTMEPAVLQASVEDIMTQTVVPEDKIPVSVLVKNAFSINAFEKAAEEKFPQLDIIQVGNYTSDRGLVEYDRRLEHDDLTDVMMTWPLDVGEEYWEDRLIDLSGLPFTANYNISMLDSISKDGKLYYVPGPAQVRGIVYNKTLFEERGWQVPQNYDEFIALCQTIEQSGMRSIQLGFENSEVLDTAFTGYSYGDCYSTPEDAQWIADYNNGTGSFGDHFGSALDTFQNMIDQGVWKKDDLEISYAEREEMLFNRRCAMVEDSVLMARMGSSSYGSTDEFALMPFFSPGTDDSWARLYMVCYIGLNKHLQEPGNEQKYDLILQLMDYISTPEGQEALAADTGAMYSSVTNVPPPGTREITDLLPCLKAGRYAIFPELKNAQNALREGLAGMVAGTLTKDDVIRMVDQQNTSPQARQTDEVLGTATAEFSLIETGNFITDVLREEAGTQIALFLDNGKDGRQNGKGVSGKIYEGNQTQADVMRIFPDLKHGEKGTLQKVTMTGQDLLDTLEYAVTVDNDSSGWFYYFSGLRMEYAPAAEPGNRIKKITDASGNAIDPNQEYSVAVMDGSVPEDAVSSCEDTGLLIMDILTNAIDAKGVISPSSDGRFTVGAP